MALVSNPPPIINGSEVRPLSKELPAFKAAILLGRRDPGFDQAFSICDIARTVFASYLTEWTLNGAEKFQAEVEQLMKDAQPVLEHVIKIEAPGPNMAYLLEYAAHNLKRIRILAVLHEEGRKAAEDAMLA